MTPTREPVSIHWLANDTWNGGQSAGATAASIRDASSANDTATATFFDTYYSSNRFVMETTLAAMATGLNGLILSVIILPGERLDRGKSRRQRRSGDGDLARSRISIYNMLFVNLSVVNLVSCVLCWFSNNLLYLFGDYFAKLARLNICRFIARLMAGVLIASALSIISALTMVSFSVVQLSAIKFPLQISVASRRRRRVFMFIAMTWLGSTIAALSCLSLVIAETDTQQCDAWLYDIVVRSVTWSVNICAALNAGLYLLNAALCAFVYRTIRVARTTMSRFPSGRRGQRQDADGTARMEVTRNDASGESNGEFRDDVVPEERRESTRGRDSVIEINMCYGDDTNGGNGVDRRRGDHVGRQRDEGIRVERRAFVTIVTLLFTLNALFVPYMIVHVLSLNGVGGDSLLANSFFVCYMNMLPYFKYASDPVVYGLRMREMKSCCRRLVTSLERLRRLVESTEPIRMQGVGEGRVIGHGHARMSVHESSSSSVPVITITPAEGTPSRTTKSHVMMRRQQAFHE